VLYHNEGLKEVFSIPLDSMELMSRDVLEPGLSLEPDTILEAPAFVAKAKRSGRCADATHTSPS